MRDRGFTLMELLVVVAIIALLLAIGMPVYRKVKETACSVICRSNLRQIGLALEMYQDDNDCFGPFLGENPPLDANGYLAETPEEMVGPYIGGDWEIWHCPADKKNEVREVWWGGKDSKYWLVPPAHLPEEATKISYVWSEYALRGAHKDQGAPTPPWEKVPYHTINEPILADGKRMLNVWDWEKTFSGLEEDLWRSSLDQSHGSGKYHKVHLLFSDPSIELVTCDETTLKSLPRF